MNQAQEFIKDKVKNWKEKRFGSGGELIVHYDEVEKWLEEYAEQKVKNLANPMLAGSFSAEYLEWVKQAELPPLTNTQHYFAEWLLKNKEMLMQIGDLDIIFTKVRKWLKNYS